MNLPNQFHKSFCTLRCMYSQLLASSVVHWFMFVSLVHVYLEASSFHPDSSLAFHQCASKLEASNTSSFYRFLIIVHRSKQHKPNVIGVHNLMDFIVYLLGVIPWCTVVHNIIQINNNASHNVPHILFECEEHSTTYCQSHKTLLWI